MKTLIHLSNLFFLFFLFSCESMPIIEGNGKYSIQKRGLSQISEIELADDLIVNIINSDFDSIEVKAEINLMNVILTNVVGDVLEIKYKDHVYVRDNFPVIVNVYTTQVLESYTISGSGTMYMDPVLSGITVDLIVSGSGDLNCDSVYADNINVKVLGSGAIKLAVCDANKLDLEVSGSGELSAKELISDETEIDVLGSGEIDISLYSTSLLSNVSGSGDISIDGYGDNQLVKIAGSGNFNAFSYEVQNCTVNIDGSGDAKVNVVESLNVTIDASGSVEYEGSPEITKDINGSGEVTKR